MSVVLFLNMTTNTLLAQQKAVIAFYNLENFFNPQDNPYKNDNEFTPEGSKRYTEAVFVQKAKNMSEVLAQIGTEFNKDGFALLGVSEVEDERALKMLLSQYKLKSRPYKFVFFDGADNRGINNALIYNTKYFKVISSKLFHVDLKHVGGGSTRDVLYVKGKLLGDVVHVLVNHWPSRSGGQVVSQPKRIAAAQVNKKIINDIQNENADELIVLMGDLNDDPIDKSVMSILNTTNNPKQALEANKMYNPWVSYYQQGRGTLVYRDKWNLFDQIILSPQWVNTSSQTWKYEQAKVFDKDFLKTSFGRYRGYPHRSYNGNKWINGYSDHLPTMIYITK